MRISQIVLFAIPLTLLDFGSGIAIACKCEHAKEYKVVKEATIEDLTPERNHGRWFITTTANTHVEFAHTAMQAVMDLHEKHNTTVTHVTIVPGEKLAFAGPNYGWAAFASDGKGFLGSTSGVDPDVEWCWRVSVAHQKLSNQQIEIAELWADNWKDFPAKSVLSSSMVDSEALRRHIAGLMNLQLDQVFLPTVHKSWYRYK